MTKNKQQPTTASQPITSRHTPPARAAKKRSSRQPSDTHNNPYHCTSLQHVGKKAEATQAATAPPASRTQAHTSQRASDIPPPAASRRTVVAIHKKVKKLEPELYKALSVMDEKTGQNDELSTINEASRIQMQ